MGSWKKMIFGEKMPDKNDPQYKERYEKEVEMGRKAARRLKLDKAAAKVQSYAIRHPRRFTVMLILILLQCCFVSIYRLSTAVTAYREKPHVTTIERQETLLKQIRESK
jgi:phage gp36-like protein